MWVIGVPFFIFGISTNDTIFIGLGLTLAFIFASSDIQKKKEK